MPYDDHEFQNIINTLTKIETTDSGSLDKKRFVDPSDPLNAPLPALKFQPTVNPADPMASAILGADSIQHLRADAKAAFRKMDQSADLGVLDATTDIDALMTAAASNGTSVNDEIKKIRVEAIKDRLATRSLRKQSIQPASLPSAPGVIPNSRPKGSTPSQRRQDLRALLTEGLGDLSAYDQETVEALLSAMEAYVTNAIG